MWFTLRIFVFYVIRTELYFLETLKFYASHLAELSFAKQRETYRNKPNENKPAVTNVIKVEDSDDDFGDPDVLPDPEEKPIILEKPKIPEKPKLKPTVPENPDNNEKDDDTESTINNNKLLEEEQQVAVYIKALQENTKAKAKLIKEKEKNIRESNEKALQLRRELGYLTSELEDKSKILDRLKKTDQLLSGDEDALEKVKNAVTAQVEKLMHLSQQWEKHRRPLVDDIRKKKASANIVSCQF